MQAGRLWTRDFIFLASGNLFMCIGFYFLIPALPVYVVDVLKADKSEVGYILAAYTLSAMIIRPFTGMALDLWGRKWIYIVSFALFSILLFIYPLMTGFLLLLILRFIHGFAWGITTTANATVVIDAIPAAKRGRGIGYFGASFTVAMAVGPMIALFILSFSDYSAMFATAGIIALVGFVMILFVKFPEFVPPKEKKSFSWSRVIEKSSLLICVPQLLFGMTYGGVVSFITLYGKEMNLLLAGPFFIIIACGIFISRLFAGHIFDKMGPYWLVISGFGTAIAGFLLLSLMQDPAGFLLSAFLIGLGGGILMPTFQTMVNNIVPGERRGAANATIFTAFDLGIGMGALVLGLLSESIGLAYMYLFCTIILSAGLAFYFLFVHSVYLKKTLMIP